MKKLVMKLAGSGLLSLVAAFVVINPASTFWIGTEQLPKSLNR